MTTDPDRDIEAMDRAALAAEVRRLRAGIRERRDASGHKLCWHHPRLWGLLPEPADPAILVPGWPHFLRGCIAYRQSLDEQAPDTPRCDEAYEGRGGG